MLVPPVAVTPPTAAVPETPETSTAELIDIVTLPTPDEPLTPVMAIDPPNCVVTEPEEPVADTPVTD
tara:strand:+ start:209 stop:409 length:201 start_codon:yes stop_codon:yes gene_type:complete